MNSPLHQSPKFRILGVLETALRFAPEKNVAGLPLRYGVSFFVTYINHLQEAVVGSRVFTLTQVATPAVQTPNFRLFYLVVR